MGCDDTLPLTPVDGGARIALKVTPKAARDAIVGLDRDGRGRMVLKVTVTAPAERGKANAAVVKLLAKTWGVPKSSLALVKGETARMKELAFMGDPAPVTAWMRDHMAKQ